MEDEISEFTQKKTEESLKYLELFKDKDALTMKLEDLKETLHLSEAKLAKTKAKFDEEKRKINEEYRLLLERKKAKFRRIREEKNEFSKKNSEFLEIIKNFEKETAFFLAAKKNLEEEISEKKLENNEIKAEITEILKKNEFFSQEKSEILLNLQAEITEKTGLKQELEKTRKIVKNLEKKAQELEESSQRDYKAFIEEKQENSCLNGEKEKLKEICSKLENQLEFVENQHNNEISELDKRAESLIEEMRFLKQENQEIRGKEVEVRKNLGLCEENLAGGKEKYLKMKFDNRALKSHLKEVLKISCFLREIQWFCNIRWKKDSRNMSMKDNRR